MRSFVLPGHARAVALPFHAPDRRVCARVWQHRWRRAPVETGRASYAEDVDHELVPTGIQLLQIGEDLVQQAACRGIEESALCLQQLAEAIPVADPLGMTAFSQRHQSAR